MSTIPTQERLKDKAKVIRKFMKEKCNVDVSHSYCIELISQLYGFKDWNTAAAALKPKTNQDDLPVFISTVGGMRKALAPFKDSTKVAAWGLFRIKAFQETMNEIGLTQGILTTEYSFIRGECSDDQVSFQLKTEDEYLSTTDEGEDADIALEDLPRN